ncbi:BON domain-containing protein [Pseudoxanthomonas beigongshangi]
MKRSTVTTFRLPLAAALATGALLASAGVMAQQQTEPEEQRAQSAQGESSQPVNDTWITTKVKTELLAAEDVSGLDIKVETTNGEVKLSGRVDNQAQIDKAVSVAREVKGVSKVDSSGLSAGTK